MSAQLLDHMFANRYYAGMLRDPWTGAEYAGRHAPMVSAAEFARIQKVVSRRSRTQPHHRVNSDFPLRGLVRCPSCEQLMTGYLAQGRHQRYPYYKCSRHDCPTRTRSYSAEAVHDEFRHILADTSVPSHLAAGVVSDMLTAHSEKTQQSRLAAVRQREEIARLKRQLQELVSMRAARLVSNEEFVTQRERTRKQIFEVQANDVSAADMPLTNADINDLTGTLSDLNVAWEAAPLSAKRGFGELLLPAGYVFRRVRTAEKGLLFRTLGTYDDRPSDVVPLIRNNLNTIIAEIHKLLAIVRHAKEARKEAA